MKWAIIKLHIHKFRSRARQPLDDWCSASAMQSSDWLSHICICSSYWPTYTERYRQTCSDWWEFLSDFSPSDRSSTHAYSTSNYPWPRPVQSAKNKNHSIKKRRVLAWNDYSAMGTYCRFTTYRHRFARAAPAPRAKRKDSKNRGRGTCIARQAWNPYFSLPCAHGPSRAASSMLP